MGTNTLETVTGGKIKTSHPNQYKTALNEDVVPRNSSGVATDVAGGLGTSALRWTTSYIQKIFFGTASNNNYIDENSNNLRINSDNTTHLSFSGTNLGSGISSSGISRDMLSGTLGQQVSSAIFFSTTSASLTDVTNATISITTTGRPVVVCLLAQATFGGSVSTDNTTTNPLGNIALIRASTELARWQVGGDACDKVVVPCGSVFHIDFPAAGTYTYKLQASAGTNTTTNISRCTLVAFEL